MQNLSFILIQKFIKRICDDTQALEENAKCIEIPALLISYECNDTLNVIIINDT